MNGNGAGKSLLFFFIFFIIVAAAGAGIYYYAEVNDGAQDIDFSSHLQIQGVSLDDTKCATFEISECPEQCKVCADCELCADLRCHGIDFCKEIEPENKPEL